MYQYDKKAPYSRKNVGMVMDENIERAMYDEILGPLVSSGARAKGLNSHFNQNSSSSTSSSSSSSSSSFPILSPSSNRPKSSQSGLRISNNNNESSSVSQSIISRLADVEEECKLLRRTLAEKCIEIDKLNKENSTLRVLKNNDQIIKRMNNEIINYKKENSQLEHQIKEMESFLADYGLLWVGNNDKKNNYNDDNINTNDNNSDDNSSSDDDSNRKYDNNNNNITSHNNDAKPKKDNTPLNQINYNLFASKIDELNKLVTSEPPTIQTEEILHTRKARFVYADELLEKIPVTLYRNGLMVKRGPFRPITSSSYKEFVRDILDGFFPNEFREMYPDGVIFDLKDNRHIDYIIGGKEDLDMKLTAAQLLGKMPKTVVRNGNIIDIRSEISDKLNNENNSNENDKSNRNISNGLQEVDKSQCKVTGDKIIVIDTPALKVTSSDSCSTVLILVKWINGSSIQMKMFSTDLIGEIREYLTRYWISRQEAEEKHSMEGLIERFELRSAFPPRLLTDSMTLEEAGLVPNGTIHARRLKLE